jgi:hypothetical protein
MFGVTDVEHAAGQLIPGVPPLPQLQYEGFEPSLFKPDDSRAELEDLKPVCPLLIEILNATHSHHRSLSRALVVHQYLILEESNILYLHLFCHLSSARICSPWD